MRRLTRTVLGIALLTAFSVSARAQSASYSLSHQGYLTDESDRPLDTSVNLKITLWNAAEGGLQRWEQSFPGVKVSKGLYTLTLGGEVVPLNSEILSEQLWMELTLDHIPLRPRQRLGAAPLAVHALNAESLGGIPADEYTLRSELETRFTEYARLDGAAFSGAVTVSSDPVAPDGVSTKRYVDAGDAARLPLAGGAMTGPLQLAGAPSSANHAASKSYVDNYAHSKEAADARFSAVGHTHVLADIANAVSAEWPGSTHWNRVTGKPDVPALTNRVTTVEGRAMTLEGRATALEGRANALEGRATALETNLRDALPVGSIVSSILTEAQFRAQVKVGNWVLSDGRALATTSRLRVLTGMTTVPDARGVFLRGKNNARATSTGDTGGERALGSYQADIFKNHLHGWTGVNGTGYPDGSSDSTTAGAGSSYPRHSQQNYGGGGDETRPRNIAVNYFIRID